MCILYILLHTYMKLVVFKISKWYLSSLKIYMQTLNNLTDLINAFTLAERVNMYSHESQTWGATESL